MKNRLGSIEEKPYGGWVNVLLHGQALAVSHLTPLVEL